MSDLRRYRAALGVVEADAAASPWADRRPWRAATHVVEEDGVVVVDLHDLSAATARAAVRVVLAETPRTGAVVFVHGRGRHSDGRGPVLNRVVATELAGACRDTPMRFRAHGASRTVWLADPARAPAALRGEWGCAWRLVLLLLGIAFLAGLASGLRDCAAGS